MPERSSHGRVNGAADSLVRAIFSAAFFAAAVRVVKHMIAPPAVRAAHKVREAWPDIEERPFHGHEAIDANIRRIVITMSIFFIVLVLILLSPTLLIPYFRGSDHAGGASSAKLLPEARSLPPQPRLRWNEAVDTTLDRQNHLRALNGYGWSDRARGIVHIPIEEAMKIYAAQPHAVRAEPPVLPTSAAVPGLQNAATGQRLAALTPNVESGAPRTAPTPYSLGAATAAPAASPTETPSPAQSQGASPRGEVRP